MGEADDSDLSTQKRSRTKRGLFGSKTNTDATPDVLPTYDPHPPALTLSEKTPAPPNNNARHPSSSTTSDNDIHNGVETGHAVAVLSVKSEHEGAPDPSVKTSPKSKPPIKTRLTNGIRRFGLHTKDALLHSWINVLLVFVPVGIAAKAVGLSPGLIFGLNSCAIIPLAGLLVYATESVARRLGDTLGALLNVSFGNAVELIIYIIALTKNEIRIVQASLLGSILSNLLLILGMSILFGGLRFQEQFYNNTVTQMSACLLSLSVISLILPTAFHASFSDSKEADQKTLPVSRATSVVLLIIYVLYLLFQLKSHAYMYVSTPQHIIDEESHPGILADVLDSSSSDDDDSSSTDSDTSGSHTTRKRIRRAFRHRRHRKSSTSSTHTPSVPSIISSPSFEKLPASNDGNSVTFNIPSRRPSMLSGAASGDEADMEHSGGRPRVRDFVDSLNFEGRSTTKGKKRVKHHKKHRKHRLDQSVPEEGQPSSRGVQFAVQQEQPAQVETYNQNAVDSQTLQAERDEAMRKGLSFRQFQTTSLRPTLPKMLTENVFVSGPPPGGVPPAPPPQPAAPTISRTGAYVLRRTTSLPDRLNRQQTGQNAGRTPSGVIGPQTENDGSAIVEEDDADQEIIMSRTSSAVLLIVSTALVAVCAEFMVDAIPGMLSSSSVSQEFVGLIILPIVSNAAEHFTAVTVAAKNKMDLAIGVSVGSSIQIALFITPFIVVLGWIIGRDMTLYFSLFETVCLFVTVFVVNFLVLDGRSNYLEGSLLMAAYTIIAVSAYYYPSAEDQSSISGG